MAIDEEGRGQAIGCCAMVAALILDAGKEMKHDEFEALVGRLQLTATRMLDDLRSQSSAATEKRSRESIAIISQLARLFHDRQ